MTEYGVKVKYQVSGTEAAVNSADRIVDKLDEVLNSVNRVNDTLDEMGTTGSEGFDEIGAGAEGSALQVAALGSIIEKVARVTVGVVKKAAEVFSTIMSQSIEYASALEESANVVEVSFGNQADAVKAWSKTTLDAYGLNEKSAMQYVSTMAAALRSTDVTDSAIANMSMNLVNLAGDIASFRNQDPETVFNKMQSGLMGMPRALYDLGIFMTEANMKAYALSKGISTPFDKLSEADQILVRYAYLMEHSTDAQGDYANTSDRYANSLRTLQQTWTELIGSIASAKDADGVSLLDRIAEIIGRITDMLRSEAATDIINKIREFALKLVDVLDKALSVVEWIVEDWDFWSDVIPKVTKGISLTSMSFGNLLTPIGLAIKGVQDLSDQNENFVTATVGSLAVAGAFIVNSVRGVVDSILDMIDGLVNPVIDFANFLANVFRDPLGAAARLFADFADDVLQLIGGITGAIDDVFGSHLKDSVMGWSSDLRSWAEKQSNGKYEQVIKRLDLSTSAFGWNRADYRDVYDKTVKTVGPALDIDNIFAGLDYLFNNKLLDKLKKKDGTDAYGDTDAILALISGISDDTGAIKNNTADNSSELAALRELAEQAAATRIANITISAPVSSSVTMNGSGETDLDGFINRFTEALSEGLNSSFTSSITLFEEAF